MDNFEHPWTSLCVGACPDDPMTLKCVEGDRQHCNQVNFQSPLMYLDDSQKHPRLQQRQKLPTDQVRAVAEDLVRGWFCGPTPVPTQVKAWSTSRTTTSVRRNPSVTKVTSHGPSFKNATNKASWITSARNASSTSIPLNGSFTSTLRDGFSTALPVPSQPARLSTSENSTAAKLTTAQSEEQKKTTKGQPPVGASSVTPGANPPTSCRSSAAPAATPGVNKSQPGQTSPSPAATPASNEPEKGQPTTPPVASSEMDQPGQDHTADHIDCE